MKAVYKKMLEGMRKKESRARRKRGEKWFVYILSCADTTLYTGITNDVERRFKMHETGKGARYTRTRRPLLLIYQESCRTRTAAMIRECAVKALPRQAKLALISGTGPKK